MKPRPRESRALRHNDNMLSKISKIILYYTKLLGLADLIKASEDDSPNYALCVDELSRKLGVVRGRSNVRKFRLQLGRMCRAFGVKYLIAPMSQA